jgi:AAA domain, putative AbiEii toxin, Type IV TA system/AAA ATPase domain
MTELADPIAPPGSEPATFLTSLELKNFRCIESLTIDFRTRMTVLFGENGSGKSSIVDAVRIAVTQLLGSVVKGSGAWCWFDPPRDVRRVPRRLGETITTEKVGDVRIALLGRFATDSVHEIGTTTALVGSILGDSNIRQWLQDATEKDGPLPLYACYRSERRFSGPAVAAEAPLRAVSRNDGYERCTDAAGDAARLVNWFNRELTRKGVTGKASPAFELVVAAIRSAIPEFETISYDPDLADIVVDFGSGEMPFGSLSDGQRGFVGLVADLAIRCHQLNPQFMGEAHRKTVGLAVIDEIDVHLHPKWQRGIVRALTDTFPLIQFILTTHSPIVLTELSRDSIVDLDSEAVDGRPLFSPYGKDSAWVTDYLMGANSRARWASAALSQIEAAIDEGDLDSARSMLRELANAQQDGADPRLAGLEAFLVEV